MILKYTSLHQRLYNVPCSLADNKSPYSCYKILKFYTKQYLFAIQYTAIESRRFNIFKCVIYLKALDMLKDYITINCNNSSTEVSEFEFGLSTAQFSGCELSVPVHATD